MDDKVMISGCWSIENPDRGENLDPETHLITGGEVWFDSATGRSEWRTVRRDSKGTQSTTNRTGMVSQTVSGGYQVRFAGGEIAFFILNSNGSLSRVDHTGMTRENRLTLTKITDDLADAPSPTPGILFNTMPKSGSIYILRSLSLGLGLMEMKVAVSLFPNDLVLRDRLDELAWGNAIAQQHLPASDINLRFIGARLPAMVVHVRDPRQATVSWLHHLQNFNNHRKTIPATEFGLEGTTPALPENYFSWSDQKQMDWLLDTHFIQLVAWAAAWTEAERKAGKPRILITLYEDFLVDRDAVFKSILKFLDIPEQRFDWAALPQKSPQTHFRKGMADEWRDVLTGDQQKRARDAIPRALAERFDWPLD
ncbi:MAG: hypothetical protein HOB79_02360 [Rhodospirillaceae bacterium]|jgi:hypothetical protein|nr:hypothetical protein [Rhodospirillaceae bacterium]